MPQPTTANTSAYDAALEQPKPRRRRPSEVGLTTTPTPASQPKAAPRKAKGTSEKTEKPVPKRKATKAEAAGNPKRQAPPVTPPPKRPQPLRWLLTLLGKLTVWGWRGYRRLNWRFQIATLAVSVAMLGAGVWWLRNAVLQLITPPVIAPFFAASVRYWSPAIARWSQTYAVDPDLIATLMQIESCGWPAAVSGSNAQGLFQVMPFHFPEPEKISMTDPDLNAKRGMGVIQDCLRRADGDVGLAMACYNGGPRLIALDQTYWPDQTQRYYYWGTGIYSDAKAGLAQSNRLQEWLTAGGKSLCQRAESSLGLPISTLPTALPASAIPTLPPDALPTFDATRR